MPQIVIMIDIGKQDKEKNLNRCVEIPDECLGVRLGDKMIDLTNYNRIVVEFICIDATTCMSPNPRIRISSRG